MEIFFVVLSIAAEFAAWILLALIVSFLIESLVEYIFGTPFSQIPALQSYKWLLMYVSAIAGVGLCFFFQLDLLYILTSVAGILAGKSPIIDITIPGIVLTGLAVGRGANYLHDFISKYLPAKKPAAG